MSATMSFERFGGFAGAALFFVLTVLVEGRVGAVVAFLDKHCHECHDAESARSISAWRILRWIWRAPMWRIDASYSSGRQCATALGWKIATDGTHYLAAQYVHDSRSEAHVYQLQVNRR